jgi:two-component system, OmpR family, response regulator ResD
MQDTRKKIRILVVDDDEILHRLLTISMERAGFETLKATNGLEAIQVLQQEVVDCILLDLMMPMMDGMRFLYWLREEEKKTTPVLVLTAMEKKGMAEDILKAGADGIIYKPIDVQEIMKKLREIQLERSH